jgi:hypothetical protein
VGRAEDIPALIFCPLFRMDADLDLAGRSRQVFLDAQLAPDSRRKSRTLSLTAEGMVKQAQNWAPPEAQFHYQEACKTCADALANDPDNLHAYLLAARSAFLRQASLAAILSSPALRPEEKKKFAEERVGESVRACDFFLTLFGRMVLIEKLMDPGRKPFDFFKRMGQEILAVYAGSGFLATFAALARQLGLEYSAVFPFPNIKAFSDSLTKPHPMAPPAIGT